MKTLFLTPALIVLAIGFAFSSHQTVWSPGVIVTKDNSLLQGEIRYNYAYDIVMYRESPQATLQTFSAQQVVSFRYYDDENGRVHYFRRYYYDHESYAARPAFFEVVVSGDISYLRRYNRSTYFDETDQRRFARNKSARMSPHVMCYDYYVHLDNEIIRSKRFKQDVLPWLVGQDIAVKRHMKKHHLSANYVDDQIQLVQYANEQMARHSEFSASIRP